MESALEVQAGPWMAEKAIGLCAHIAEGEAASMTKTNTQNRKKADMEAIVEEARLKRDAVIKRAI